MLNLLTRILYHFMVANVLCSDVYELNENVDALECLPFHVILVNPFL
jgi:hypothetical protein